MADPIQSGVDSDYKDSVGGDVGLPDSVKSALKTDMSDPLAQFKKISGEERAKVGKAESDLAEAQITQQQQAARLKADLANKQASQMSGLLSQYEKQAMAPAPKREIDAQTKEGMMGLAALLPVAGAFFGGKGLTSATGAMQAMTGLLKGYQEGNKERIAFEQKKYDDAMKEFDRHQNQIKEAFNIAIKKAQVNQTAAQTELEVKLSELNAPLLREMVKKNGIVAGAEENIKMAQNYYTHKQQYEEKLNIVKEIQQAKAGAGSELYSDDALNTLVDRYFAGDKSVFQGLGTGIAQQQVRARLQQKIADKGKELGLGPKDVMGAQAEFEGQKASQRTLGQLEARTVSPAIEAQQMGDYAVTLGKDLPRGKFVPLNQLLQTAEANISDPRLLKFKAATTSFINQYARAITPIGATTDLARKKAFDMLNTATSQKTFEDVVGVMNREMEIAQKAPVQAGKKIGEAYTGKGGQPEVPAVPSEVTVSGW